MVVKTDLCAFSEYRIFPGHGIRMIRRDGQLVTLLNAKCKSLVKQRKKSAKLTWTQTWRRLNKKIKDDSVARKKTRKTAKIQRAIVGASVEFLKSQKQAIKPKTTAEQAAIAEIKARKKAAAGAKGGFAKGGAGGAVPKNQKSAQSMKR
jgi:large subunit ribosomal protein L24e